jgi:hypothetical protein
MATNPCFYTVSAIYPSAGGDGELSLYAHPTAYVKTDEAMAMALMLGEELGMGSPVNEGILDHRYFLYYATGEVVLTCTNLV